MAQLPEMTRNTDEHCYAFGRMVGALGMMARLGGALARAEARASAEIIETRDCAGEMAPAC